MLWRRADGDLVRDVDHAHRIMPYIMRGRNESAFYMEQHVDLRRADAFVRAFNVAHPGAPMTVQHLLMWAIREVMVRYPTMNRFVAGGRLFQRRGIWFSYSAKRELRQGSPVVVVKRRFEPGEPFDEMVTAMKAQLATARFGGLGHTDREVELIMKLPGLGRRLLLALGRFADAFGLLPNSLIEPDPLYATAFFANLASMGMDAGWHHLYEYGTIGVFCVMGRAVPEPGSPTSGPDRRRSMVLRWTFDERVEDGLTSAYSLRYAKSIIEDPVGSGLDPLAGATAAVDSPTGR
jgi:hypothetical protein